MEYSRYEQVVETREIVHWLLRNYQLRCPNLSQITPSGGRIILKEQPNNKITYTTFWSMNLTKQQLAIIK